MTNNPICEDCDYPQTFCVCCEALEDRREYEKEARDQWAKDNKVLEMIR